MAALPAMADAPGLADHATQQYPTPQRVVSMNLCTDQLAMLLAAPGQLISVSGLAADPLVSLMPDQARGYALNQAQAEDLYLLKPDLVLAGSYTATASVEMLRRLGLRVETLPPANSLEDIRQGIVHMGALLDRQPQAQAMLAQLDADLDAIAQPQTPRLAASYDANGYSVGRQSLSGDVMRAAGLELVPDRLGLHHGGPLPLEQLIMAAPDLIVTGTRYAQPSRAEDILDHPALAHLQATRHSIPDRDWICGLPHIAHTAAELAKTP